MESDIVMFYAVADLLWLIDAISGQKPASVKAKDLFYQTRFQFRPLLAQGSCQWNIFAAYQFKKVTMN
jgi:hypothetical protein